MRLFLFGLLLGLIFGALNLLLTWLHPLAEDTIGALLLFYGPMFFVWGVVSFRAARRTGRLLAALVAGATIACGTFVTYDLLMFVRVNLFLSELTGRADWQNMIMRFRASGSESFRSFVNLEYVKGAPFKLLVSCGIGALMGALGGIAGSLGYRRPISAA